MIRELCSLGLLARIVRVGFLPIPSKMVGHGQALPQEVVGTMIEMADVAWNALKHRRKRKAIADEDEEISHLKSENERLKEVLAENLVILHKLSQNSDLAKDCPSDLLKEFPKDLVSLKRVQVFCFYIGRPDLSLNFVEQLYARLETAVDSSSFLAKLESLHQESNAIPSSYPPRECTDLKEIDLSVNVDGEPCWWIWVSKDMVQDNLEESSGIDNENYVIISEENVGLIGLTGTVIYFLARIILCFTSKAAVVQANADDFWVSIVINDKFGIVEVLMTTVHAITAPPPRRLLMDHTPRTVGVEELQATQKIF